MKMYRKIFVLLILFILIPKKVIGIATDSENIVDTFPILTQYSNGAIKDSGQAIKTIDGRYVKNGIFKTYYSNGKLKDSSYFKNEEIVGERKTYYSNGTLRNRFVFTDFNDTLKIIKSEIYSRNGKIKSEQQFLGNKAYGEMIKYRSGKPWLYADMNKGRRISIPSSYRNGKHIKDKPISDEIITKRIVLQKNKEQKKLDNNTLTKIGLTDNNTVLTHCLVEGYTENEVLLSRFSYDLNKNRNTLKFDSLSRIDMNRIEYYELSNKNVNLLFWTAFTLHIAGAVILIESIAMPIIMKKPKEILSTKMLPFFAIGFACYIPGKLMYRLTIPKKYDIKHDWKIKEK